MPVGSMTFTNMKQSAAVLAKPLVTADDQKKLDQRRKKVMSHQQPKGHQTSQSEERSTTYDSQTGSSTGLDKPLKKAGVRGS